VTNILKLLQKIKMNVHVPDDVTWPQKHEIIPTFLLIGGIRGYNDHVHQNVKIFMRSSCVYCEIGANRRHILRLKCVKCDCRLELAPVGGSSEIKYLLWIPLTI